MIMRRFCFYLCLAGIFATAFAAPRPVVADPVHVQIKNATISAISEKGYQGRIVVTTYMTVTDADAFERLCARLPVLMDVIAQIFENNPLKLDDIDKDVLSRQPEIRETVTSALGTGIFEAMYIVRGGRQRGEMTELVSINGGTRDCNAIAYLPWARPAAAVEPAPPRPQEGLRFALPDSDPMSQEMRLSDAELERFLENELHGVFPNEPEKPQSPPWVEIALAVFGLTGLLLVVGSYIGYQVGKVRRDRRRKDRRKMRKERRSGKDRRQLDKGPLPGIPDRRASGGERRSGDDRRTGDRRSGPRKEDE